MALAYASAFSADRDQVVKQLQKQDTASKLNGLRRCMDFGAHGTAHLGLAAEVARLLQDTSEEVQLLAMEVLGTMGEAGAEFAERIANQLCSKSYKKRCYAVASLGMMEMHAARYKSDVAKCLRDDTAMTRAAACLALGNMRADSFVDEVATCLEDASDGVAPAAIIALSKLVDVAGARKYSNTFAKKLWDGPAEVKKAVLQYFAKFAELAPQHADEICACLCDTDIGVRGAVAFVVGAVDVESQERMVAAAAKILQHQEPGFRAAAAMAIGAAGAKGKDQAGELEKLLEDTSEDDSQYVMCIAGIEPEAPSYLRIPCCAAMCALAAIGHASSGPRIEKLLAVSMSRDVQVTAATALVDLDGDFERSLLQMISAPQVELRVAVTRALGKTVKKKGAVADARVASEVADKLVDRSPLVRAAAAEALGAMGIDGATYTEAITALLKDRASNVRVAACTALVGVGVKGQMFAPLVAQRLYDDFPEVKIAAAHALSNMGARGAAFADEMAPLASNDDSGVRIAVLEALASMGESARPYFETAAMRARDNDRTKAVRDVGQKLLLAR